MRGANKQNNNDLQIMTPAMKTIKSNLVEDQAA